jgi:ParB/RepB/Spo0J family partition protein
MEITTMAKTSTTAATVTPLRPATPVGDSTGITPASPLGAAVVMVPLDTLAPHPENPRTGLGDLTELAASIKAQGLLQPLVVLTAAAYTEAAEADGDPDRPAAGITHVIVAGHRRAEACRIAGLAAAPAVVRDDLAGAPALAAMLSENVQREALTPLAEAEGFARLARRGWRQRRIAEETGCSQAHVSKRMTLLKLPEAARGAVAAGTLPVDAALELHKLTGNGGADEVTDSAITQAVQELDRGYDPRAVIRTAQAEVRRAREAQAARAKLEADGTPVITEQQVQRAGYVRLYGDTGPHAEAGCLAAYIGSYRGEPEYVCTKPASHPRTKVGREARADAERRETERESRKAAKARDEACQQLAAGPLPPARELVHEFATVLLGGTGDSEAVRLAWRWLRDSGAVTTGQDVSNYYDRTRTVSQLNDAGDRATLHRWAWAYCLAAEELRTRSRGYGTPAWTARHTAHVEHLQKATGYQPTAWETRQITQQQAVQDAAGTLACKDCGCTRHQDGGGYGCGVRWDSEHGQPVHTCAWNCTTHQAAEEAAQAPADGRDAFFDAVEDAVYALGPTRGHDLPAELETAAAELAEAFAQQDGNSPLGPLTTAAAAVTTAARGCTDLPGEVTAALGTLQAILPGQGGQGGEDGDSDE